MSSPIAAPFGLILIGVFISLILFGIIVSQVFTYYQNSDKDPLWQKLFVAVVFTLDTLSTIFAMWWMYWLLIDNWGKIDAFTQADWLLGSDPMIAGIVGSMVQCFFAWRLLVITRKKWLTMIIVLCAVFTVCGGIGTGIACIWVKDYTLFLSFKQITVIWLISAALGDIGITMALTYHLHRRKGSFEATDKLLDRIIKLTVQNGLFTALIAIIDVCMYLSDPIPYHMALSFLMPKLYSNTILSSLNARTSMRRDLAIASGDSGLGVRSTVRPVDVVNLASNGTSSSNAKARPEVFVGVEVHEMSDAKIDDGQPEWDMV
ncbi:hypothetical protein FIBSPDRAFT_937904 [Athelia psychrophila]|uniref:DUF6534 domain-containing protein n=1 Tax=Athelia psychrophila TaxID=1759441 RepID=A0A165ZK87_9AGAM|nr:hypothetical protein FIBSPDRAFT_937904 [Fibularhizoctonia sp. CBS 109695]